MLTSNFPRKGYGLLQHKNWRLNLLSKCNPEEVKQLANEIIAKEYEIDDDFSKEGIIAREVGKTTWESFCRFGNRRNASRGMVLCWISPEAMTLDEQAYWMTENHGREFLPDDLAEFMMNHERGKNTYRSYEELEELKKAFRDLTGFRWNLAFAKEVILKVETEEEDIF